MTSAGTARLLVASNRGPLTVASVESGEDEVRRGGGGLVTGMQAALAATDDAVWVCAALNDRERTLARRVADGRMSELPQVADALAGDFEVRMLPIDAPTFRAAYNAISNSTLWFVLHRLFELTRSPNFDATWRRQWAAYERYNAAFAQALDESAAPEAAVMVQDYHLFLVPRMLRRRRPDLRIGFFTHTPWVGPDMFSTLPDDVAFAVVDGMLGADVVGFHTRRWARLFDETVRALTGRGPDVARVFPLGVDREEMTRVAGRRDVAAAGRVLEQTVGDRKVIGRVDRTEPAKNVWRGLLAYRELLRRYPEWRGRVVHTVYNNPSRDDLPAYREYTAAVERLAAEIDDEFATDDWTPLTVDIVDDYPAALAVMKRSDVIFINSIRDGMNLVVLESLMVNDRDPAVVISRDMGAAELLGDGAVTVNPFDISAAADALHEALLLPADERRIRAEEMRRAAVTLPPDKWFEAQLRALPSERR